MALTQGKTVKDKRRFRALMLAVTALATATAMGVSLRSDRTPARTQAVPIFAPDTDEPDEAPDEETAAAPAQAATLAPVGGSSDAAYAWMQLPLDAGLPPMGRVRIHIIDGAGGAARQGMALSLRQAVQEEAARDASFPSPIVYTTQTDGSGTAELIVPVGTYLLAPGQPMPEEGEERVVVPAEGLEKTWVLRQPGVLEGRIVNTEGRGIPNATIRSQSSHLNADNSVLSAEDGTFHTKITPGIYAIEVSAPQYAPVRRDGIQVRSGALRRESFSLAPLDAVLVLHARCDDGPCDRAQIQVEWMGGSRNARTNPEGVVTLASLPRSEVDVRVVWNAGQMDERRMQTSMSLAARRQERTLQLEPVADPPPVDSAP